MVIFLAIALSTIWLGFSFWGVGYFIRKTDAPAAAIVRGWTIFLMFCTLAWFFKFPADRLVLPLWALTIFGSFVAVRALPLKTLLWAMGGMILISCVLAFPFLKIPDLLAYAHWGTDQWGYAVVAKWLVHHSLDNIPAINNRPGMDWIWFILTVKDRPLMYIVLATLSAAFTYKTIVAYTVLPAALMAGIFLSFFLEERPLGIAHPVAKFFVSLGISVQPLVLMHFEHQFLGGTADGLVMMLITAAALHVQAREPGEPLFYGSAFLLSVLAIGLYTVTVPLVSIALLSVIFLWSHRRRFLNKGLFLDIFRPRWTSFAFVISLLVAYACYAKIRALVPESIAAPAAIGQEGHVWAQLSSIYGQTFITPWYGVDDSPGWLNPAKHNPPLGGVRVTLLAALILFLILQSWRWWAKRKDVAVVLFFAVSFGILLRAAPPRGTHWFVSRTLPIFGEMLLMVAAAGAIGETRRWIRYCAVALTCLPLVLGAPGLYEYIGNPVNKFASTDGDHPPQDEAWHALAYAYFYQDHKDIDWSAAPKSSEAMTHYIPEEIRPKIPTK